MTDQSSPITPPDALRAQWRTEAPIYRDFGVGRENWLMNRAAQWGADQELEACIEWFDSNPLVYHRDLEEELRAARRPKPPSLKERIAAAITEGDERTALLLLNEALPND
jgi:hypothetical protein